MLKIVLIDDEAIVLRGISAILKKQVDFELVGTADNGIDGMKTVLETRPDIIMTDIRMPGMNGLEMIRQIQRQLPHTVYIVFSGFNEFTYVKEAIGLGVIDYLEKPVTVPDLKKVLKKAAGILEYQSSYRQLCQSAKKADRAIMEKHLRDLYERSGEEPELLEQIRKQELELTECYSLCVIKMTEEKGKSVDDYRNVVHKLTFDMIKNEPVRYYSFYAKENLVIVYFNLGKMEFPFLDKVREQKHRIELEGTALMVGISLVHRKFTELKKAFEEADHAFRYAKYLGETEAVSFHEVSFVGTEKEKVRPDYESMTFLFRTGQYKGCREEAEAYLMGLRSREYLPRVYMQYCWEYLHFMQIMLNEMDNGNGEYFHIDYYELLDKESEEEITAWTREKIERILDLAEHRQNDGSSRAIRRLKVYIGEHYAEGISLDELADQVHMSKTYISMLFKKEEGISYIKYLTKVRIGRAMEFLKQGYKAKEVCEMVGYHDYKYFSTQFKASTGMTLENYKKSL